MRPSALAASSVSEQRVKRVLDLHLDGALLEHLATLAHVFSASEEEAPPGAAAGAGPSLRIPRTAAGLRMEIDKRSLQVARSFLQRMAPLDGELRAVSDATDAVARACREALERAEQDERVSAAFLAAAADTARRKAVVQADVERLRTLASQYTLSAECGRALEEGPDAPGFFEAVARVEGIRARALHMVSGEGELQQEGGAAPGGAEAPPSSSAALIGEHALGLELLEGATAAHAGALSALFDWCLARCRQADALFSGATAEAEESELASAERRDREAVLGRAATDRSGHTLDRALRKGLALLASNRPGFCRACQEAAVGSRRAAFVRSFVAALSVGSSGLPLLPGGGGGGSGGGGGEGGNSRTRAINANAHDSLRYVSDLCAWVHLHCAEETEAFAGIFKDATGPPAAPAAAGAAGAGSEAGSESPTTPQQQQRQAEEVSTLFTSAEMVTSVCDGLARPLALRIEQVILSSSTSLATAFRLTDVIAYYVGTLRGLLTPQSALLAGLVQVHERCVSRVEELLALQTRRLREATPAYPSSLSLTPMVADVVALLEDVLTASASSLLSAGSGSSSSAGAVGAAALDAPAPPAALGTVDVAHVLEALIEPLLESARSSAQGLRLLDTATFMCNQVCVLQHALAPFAVSSRVVQRLAAELSAYEESMVQALSEEVLSEAGLLGKLAALRSQPPGACLAELPGLRLGELRSVCSALVSEVSGGGGGGGPLGAFDRIDNPRVRSRLRRDASQLLLEAFAFLRRVVADPASGYGGEAGAAELPSMDQLSVLLDLS
jgi:hypothetical protein